jgi:hypothetical protein
MTPYSNKEKPEPDSQRVTDNVIDLAEEIQDLRFHIYKLEHLKKQYESEGKKDDARMVELFAEEHKKEIDELQKKLNWENIKLSSLTLPSENQETSLPENVPFMMTTAPPLLYILRPLHITALGARRMGIYSGL